MLETLGLNQFPVVVVGAVAMALMQPQVAGALTAYQVSQIARDTTVLIDGLNPGSGFILSRTGNTYTVLTARHVVATEDEYTIVTPDGANYPVDYRTVRKLPGVDLALVSFTSDRSYAIASLADYEYDARFRNVFTSGWLKDRQTGARTHRFTAGILANQDFEIPLTQEVSRDGYTLFYSNITGVGMSGGPVLDTDGRVIGVHGRSKAEEVPDDRRGGVSRVNRGFSSGIPIATFLKLVPQTGLNLALAVQNTPPTRTTPQQVESIRPFLDPTPLPANANAIDWTNQGNQLYRVGRLQDALLALNQAVQLKPDFYPAWYERGNVLFAMKQPYEALASYDRVVQLKPDFYDVWRDRGVLLVTLNDYMAALWSFDRATQIKPDDYVLWYMRGNLLNRNLQNYSEAIASYNRSLRINPNFADALTGRGKALYEQRRYGEALTDLNRALQIAPNLTVAWILKARTLNTMQRYPEAIATVQQALKLQPNNPELRRMLTGMQQQGDGW
ncbi:serine protease [Kovacikia minuta CCNUW1]|uniref:tetratricopeptide repeat-containing S1 family peptidase n=1 Tax=Kovacikia minuta TaxID=2931930 RepID=UPI001CC97811|nr:tetratricopeptide repeat-containing serine protease family protein [Kovacikia minuta]UBF28391.1 serine protease [Kovacikia minuta CCNUW1]